MSLKAEDTKDGVKLRDTETGKLAGSVPSKVAAPTVNPVASVGGGTPDSDLSDEAHYTQLSVVRDALVASGILPATDDVSEVAEAPAPRAQNSEYDWNWRTKAPNPYFYHKFSDLKQKTLDLSGDLLLLVLANPTEAERKEYYQNWVNEASSFYGLDAPLVSWSKYPVPAYNQEANVLFLNMEEPSIRNLFAGFRLVQTTTGVGAKPLTRDMIPTADLEGAELRAAKLENLHLDAFAWGESVFYQAINNRIDAALKA